MIFHCINIGQVPWGLLKTLAFGLNFEQLSQDLATVNAGKIMFDPYIQITLPKLPYFFGYKKDYFPSKTIPKI